MSESEQWIERATYDFKTARAMLEAERFLYVIFCSSGPARHPHACITSRVWRNGPDSGLTRPGRSISPDSRAITSPARYPGEMPAPSAAADETVAEETLQAAKDIVEWLLNLMT